MKDLEEIKQRILSELEEWGAENVPTLMNTVLAGQGDEEEANLFVVSLKKLAAEGLVCMAHELDDEGKWWNGLSRDESVADVLALPQFLKFLNDDALWTDTRITGAVEPQVVVTDSGRIEAEKILNQRGYQWWRRKEKPRKTPIVAVEPPEAFLRICAQASEDVEKVCPPYQELARAAVHGLTESETLELAIFLHVALGAQYTAEELQALWRRSGARFNFETGEHIRLVLQLMRERLPSA